MECFKTKTRNCIGGYVKLKFDVLLENICYYYLQAAEGGLTELQNLAQWCCVNPGEAEPAECPLSRKYS